MRFLRVPITFARSREFLVISEKGLSVDLTLPAYQIIHCRAALKGANSGRSDESAPIEAIQQIPVVMDPGVRRDDWGGF